MIAELKSKFNGMGIEINKKKELQYLEQVAKLSTHTTEPSQHFNYTRCDYEESTIPLNEIDSQTPPSIEITPVLPNLEPEDSLIMGNEELSTIPEKGGYHYHPLHVASYPFDQIQPDMSLSEEPESILDRQERVMRNKVIPFVKILWKNHPEREATWETEESMRASYPHFFV
ncbi:putative nucleotidyltransferase, ribonuclease H [Tanacetum coccineum]